MDQKPPRFWAQNDAIEKKNFSENLNYFCLGHIKDNHILYMPAKMERKKISLKWRKATRKIMKISKTNTNCENVRNFVMFGKKIADPLVFFCGVFYFIFMRVDIFI